MVCPHEQYRWCTFLSRGPSIAITGIDVCRYLNDGTIPSVTFPPYHRDILLTLGLVNSQGRYEINSVIVSNRDGHVRLNTYLATWLYYQLKGAKAATILQ